MSRRRLATRWLVGKACIPAVVLVLTGGCSSLSGNGVDGVGTGGVSATGSGGTGGTVDAAQGGTISGTGGTVFETGGLASLGGADGTATTGGRAGTGGVAGTGGATHVGSTGGLTSVANDCPDFSFFVTSQTRLFALAKSFNGSTNGFGSDLRYGESGAGAGLRGADKICTQIAEQSCAGNGKTWHAFISVSDGGSGAPVNAIDRVGSGPWYDRLGQPVAQNKTALQGTRPTGADAAIINDLPNEDGFNNHAPDGTTQIDNHNVMTGSDATGRLATSSAFSPTCKDWTDATTGTNAGGLGPNIGNSWWGGSGAGGNFQGWIYAGHNAAGCQPGAIDPTANCGFGVGQGCTSCATVGCMGGYGGLYCFAVQP